MANGRQGRGNDRLADDGGQRNRADELQLAVGKEADFRLFAGRRRCLGNLKFSYAAWPIPSGLRLIRYHRGGFHFHLGASLDETLDFDHRHRRIMAADDVPVGGTHIF